MTNEKTEKVMYETPSGEIFDVKGAFERHPAITPGKANIDLWVNADRHGGIYFEIRLYGETMARLTQILNSAPVDGNPLNVAVNLENDSNASDHARENIARYLEDNGYEATLENIAAGYIYNVDSLDELQVYAAGHEYVISRITTLTGTFIQKDITSPTIYETRAIASTPDSSVMFTSKNKRMSEFTGEEYDGYRIVKTLEPGGYAINGGVIMERIKDGE